MSTTMADFASTFADRAPYLFFGVIIGMLLTGLVFSVAMQREERKTRTPGGEEASL